MLLDRTSLAQTVDAVNEATFFERPILRRHRAAIARWIASRHGFPGGYADTFALFGDEREDGVRLFTGERTMAAAARHTMAQEACRVLRLLNVGDKRVLAVLATATANLADRLGPVGPRKPRNGQIDWLAPFAGGTYCCGRCSAALWRHITVGGFDNSEHRLSKGLQCLRHCRRGDGQWRAFPFWYTLSALVEMDGPVTRTELRYAAPVLEKHLRRAPRPDQYSQRRHAIAQRALARV
jgi:hypothetical protein